CCGLLMSAGCPTLQPALALPTKQGHSPVDTRSWQSASSSFCSPVRDLLLVAKHLFVAARSVHRAQPPGHTGAPAFGLRTKAAFSWPPLPGRARGWAGGPTRLV